VDEASASVTFAMLDSSPLILSATPEIRRADVAAGVGATVLLVINQYQQWMCKEEGSAPR